MPGVEDSLGLRWVVLLDRLMPSRFWQGYCYNQ